MNELIEIPKEILFETLLEFYTLTITMPYLLKHQIAVDDLSKQRRVLQIGSGIFNDFSLRNLVDSYDLHALIMSLYSGGFPPNSSILQVGCNYAPYLKYLKETRPDLKLTGIDLSEYGVNFGKTFGGLDLRLMDAFNLQLPDESFDFVLSDNFIDETYMKKSNMIIKGIAEVYRVLKQGGKFIVKAISLDRKRLITQGFNKVTNYYNPLSFSRYGDLIVGEK